MTKYNEYFDRMVSENKEAFDKFAKLHVDYGMNEDKFQEEVKKHFPLIDHIGIVVSKFSLKKIKL